MTRMLITGDTGLLGSNLVREASEIYEVIGLSRGSCSSYGSWQHISTDLIDGDATCRCLDEIRPDFIVHCAAVTDVERCEAQSEYVHAVNVGATERIARWAGQHDASLTYISTDSVFDGTKGSYSEENAPAPVNHYARTKLAGEQAAAGLCADSLVVRTNFYGWNENGKPTMAKWMHHKLLCGETLMAFTDVYFSPLFVNDLAKLILELISRGANGIFHLGAKNSCSKYEFANLLCKAFGFDSRRIRPILLEEFPFVAPRPRNATLSVAKCTQFLGREMPEVEQGIAAFAETMRSNAATRVEDIKADRKGAAVSY